MNNAAFKKTKKGLFYCFLASTLITFFSVLVLILPDLSSKTVLGFITESLIVIMVWVFWVGITTYAVMTIVGIPVFVILKKIKVLSISNYVFVGTFFGYYLALNLTSPQLTEFDFYLPYLCAFYGFACSTAFYIGCEEK